MAGACSVLPTEQALNESSRWSRATILLVEDDPVVADMLRDRLGARGHKVWHAATGAEAEAIGHEITPDLVIVDLGLPDANGLVLCSDLRERWTVPIIVCTASRNADDAVLSFRLGADDFIRKPFSTDELEARIQAALGRPGRRGKRNARGTDAVEDDVQHIGTLVIDHAQCSVSVGDIPVHLTPTEFRLLSLLADHPDRVVSTSRLGEQVWGSHDESIARSLQVHVRRMRLKLKATGALPPAIVAVRGFGYKLVAGTSVSFPSPGR